MPIYEYEISGTGKRYEVIHSANSELKTWGDLSKLLDVEIGSIQADTPVNRTIGGRLSVSSKTDSTIVQKKETPQLTSCCGGRCSSEH